MLLRPQDGARSAEALALIDQALALLPEHPGSLIARGVALEKMGRLPEAVESFMLAAQHSTDDSKASVLFRLGQLQYMYVRALVAW